MDARDGSQAMNRHGQIALAAFVLAVMATIGWYTGSSAKLDRVRAQAEALETQMAPRAFWTDALDECQAERDMHAWMEQVLAREVAAQREELELLKASMAGAREALCGPFTPVFATDGRFVGCEGGR